MSLSSQKLESDRQKKIIQAIIIKHYEFCGKKIPSIMEAKSKWTWYHQGNLIRRGTYNGEKTPLLKELANRTIVM